MILESFRSAFRRLRADPGFTLTAVLTLAFGIGGNVAMFTLVNSILLKPLAYRDPDSLVLVTQSHRFATAYNPSIGLVPTQFTRWRNETTSIESIALMLRDSINLSGSGVPETLGALRISGEFFDTLGVTPQLGRWFTELDEKRGRPDVVIITDSLWRQRFSADPNIVGKKIILDNAPYVVIGITPANLRLFRGRQLHPLLGLPHRTDAFLPLRFSVPEEQGRFNCKYLGIARLKPGITPARARAELDHSLPTFQFNVDVRPLGLYTIVQPLQTALVGDVRTGLVLLLVSVGLVLLIACANLANLGLVRAARRRKEIAIRVALGAGKRDLVGDALAESFLIAIVGTTFGLLVSAWITDVVISFAPSELPRLEETTTDVRVYLFAATICIVTTFVFGLLPAWSVSRVDPQESLNEAGRSHTDTRRGGRIRGALVGLEVALGTVLVIGSGLLLLSLHRVLSAPKGFEGDRILTVDLTLPQSKYGSVEQMAAFLNGAREAVASIPGIVNAAASTALPLEGNRGVSPAIRQGAEDRPLSEYSLMTWPAVTAEYFSAMKIPVLEGRSFREGETERVAVVSHSAARKLWPGESAIGRMLTKDESPHVWWRVVGMVGDIRSAGLDQIPTPAIYQPYWQYGRREFSMVVRTALAPDAVSQIVRQTIWRVDSDIPVPEMRTMPSLISQSAQERRFQALLVVAFAGMGVLLAAIGIYGVVAYSLALRRRELGVRIALGANRRQVGRLIYRNGMTPVFVGLFAGLLAARVLTRLIDSLLFEVSALDPTIFGGATLILLASGVLPCWIITREAARIDPVTAMRLD